MKRILIFLLICTLLQVHLLAQETTGILSTKISSTNVDQNSNKNLKHDDELIPTKQRAPKISLKSVSTPKTSSTSVNLSLNSNLSLNPDHKLKSTEQEVSKIGLKSTFKTKTDVAKTLTCTAGGLSSLLSSLEKRTLTALTLMGTIDARDFKTMRDSMPELAIIDISRVTILAYSGNEGTASSASTNYEANTIPANAFYWAATDDSKLTLTSFSMPMSVTNIDNNAFNGCVNLSGNLVLPSSLKRIGDLAFIGCNKYSGQLNIPTTVTTIGKAAFYLCSGFSGSLDIPSSVTKLGEQAFWMCKGLNGSLSIPATISSIGYGTFFYCTGLTGKLTIPSSVTSIGNRAFYNCSGFSGQLTLPSTLDTIHTAAFYDCSGLTSALVLPSSIKIIEAYAFRGCTGLNGSLTLPSSLKSIENYAFAECVGFNGNLTLPSTLDTINEGVFYDCSGLKGSLSIPASVKSIKGYAFRGCSGLSGSLTLPSSLKSIGKYAFAGCYGFNGGLTLPTELKAIQNGVFYDCNGLTGSLNIPPLVASIDSFAFRGCSGLTSVLTIGYPVTTVQQAAFALCSGLTCLKLDSSVINIGNSAFYGCSSLTSIIEGNSTPVNLNSTTSVFSGVNTNTCILYVPSGSKASYASAAVWKDFSNIIETVINLTPYNQTGWSDKIVISKLRNTKIDDNINVNDSVFVDFAFINTGNIAVTRLFYASLYLDNVLIGWYYWNELLLNHVGVMKDIPIGKLTYGSHTLKVIIDSTNLIYETDETDNIYSKTFFVTSTEEPLDTDSDGYRNVSTFANLAWILENDNSHTLKYKLDNDIDASESSQWYLGKGFKPITNFLGIIDGQGHSIKYLTFNRTTQDSVAFISKLSSGGVIRNLALTNCNVKGQNYSAGLVAINNGTISNCSCTGTISGNNNVGGVTGINNGTIKYSCNSALITGNDYVGGLAGNSTYNSIISKSYNQGKVIGKDQNIAGITGINNGKIIDCYNAGSIIGSGEVGGIAGWNNGTISNVYNVGLINGAGNAIGAIIGIGSGSSYSFSNKETSGGITSQYGVNGTQKTTLEMKTQSTFTNWDFANTWEILPTMNDGYPQLNWSTNPKRIKSYSSDKVANVDSCSITFEGSGFDSNTKVFLSKPGQDTIKADTLIVSGTYCITRFNLKNKAIGSWNIIVQYPDTTLKIQNGLTVEAPKKGGLKIEILGADKIRTGRPTSITVRITNTGNTTIENPIIHIAVDSQDSTFLIESNTITDIEREFCIGLNIDIDKIIFSTTTVALEHKYGNCRLGTFISKPLEPYSTKEIILNIKSKGNVDIAAWQADFTFEEFKTSISSVSINEKTHRLKSANLNSDCVDDLAKCYTDNLKEAIDACWSDITSTETQIDALFTSLGAATNPLIDLLLNKYQVVTSAQKGDWVSMGGNYILGYLSLALEYAVPAAEVTVAQSVAKAFIPIAIGKLVAYGAFIEWHTMVDGTSDYFKQFNPAIDCMPMDNKSKTSVKAVSSFDPNDKIGYRSPSGSTYFNDNNTNFTYIIYFENKETASAPAQEVTVIDTLDLKLFNIESFKVGYIKIGNNTYSAPLNVQENKWTIDMRPEKNLITYVTLTLNKQSGVAKWYFRCVDPTTMEFPEDATEGFLPPNDSLGNGEGSVMFTINLKDSTTEDASIKNKAQIVFDNNAPIYTPTWTNTKDILAPISNMNQPAIVSDSIATLSWKGTDNKGGSGVYIYNVYMKKSNEAYSSLLTNTAQSSIDFKYKKGIEYSFYVTATDSAGNTETKTNVPDIKLIQQGTGINDISNSSKNTMTVYPNPSSENKGIKVSIAVESPEYKKLVISTVYGSTIKTIPFNGNELEVKGLANGMYIFTLKVDNRNVISKKVVITQ